MTGVIMQKRNGDYGSPVLGTDHAAHLLNYTMREYVTDEDALTGECLDMCHRNCVTSESQYLPPPSTTPPLCIHHLSHFFLLLHGAAHS